jgi:L-lactate dehydrogenase
MFNLKHWQDAEKFGLTDEVFLSVPCVVGRDGVLSLLSQILNDSEAAKFKTSAYTLAAIQKDIKF